MLFAARGFAAPDAGAGAAPARPLFSFGIVTDVQYADRDGSGSRHYREAPERLREAVTNLNARDLRFTIQLGDIIDGAPDQEQSQADVEKVLAVFDQLRMRRFHTFGNHCFAAGREWLLNRYKLEKTYYSFTDDGAPGWRFLVLDGKYRGYGTIGPEQCGWLASELAAAATNRERVILFCHFPLADVTVQPRQDAAPVPLTGLLTNAPGVVQAGFAGHLHGGGYAFTGGMHFVTVKGIVEAPRNAWAVVEVYSDRIREIGGADEPSRDLPLTRLPGTNP